MKTPVTTYQERETRVLHLAARMKSVAICTVVLIGICTRAPIVGAQSETAQYRV